MTFRTLRSALLPALALLLAVPLPAAAHDFWLRPSSFRMDAPGGQVVRFEVGHPSERSPWPLTPWRTVSFLSHGPDGVRDQQAGVPEADEPLAGRGAARVRLRAPGAHIVAFEGRIARSDLPAGEFLDYARKEGLTPILARHEGRDDAGVETYSRRGKAYVRVGDARVGEAENAGDESHLTEPLGHTLELVPGVDPTRLEPGGTLPLTVLWQGEPLAGARVSFGPIGDTAGADGERGAERSDEDGRVAFEVPMAGEWMAHVIWSRVLPENSGTVGDADYDTVFSSLSFAVED